MDEWSNPIKVPPLPETITTGGTGKVEYVAVSVTELATLRAENERLAKSLKEYKEAAEILDAEWDGRHTVESALSQARAEIVKEEKPEPERDSTLSQAHVVSYGKEPEVKP